MQLGVRLLRNMCSRGPHWIFRAHDGARAWRPEGVSVQYTKAPDRRREVRYAARSGAGVTSLGGNQARMNWQYSGQCGRLPQPGLADASERLGMQSIAFKHALCDRNSCSHSTMAKLAHNLGADWRRFFKIAARNQARGPGFEGCKVNAKPISSQGHGHSCHL